MKNNDRTRVGFFAILAAVVLFIIATLIYQEISNLEVREVEVTREVMVQVPKIVAVEVTRVVEVTVPKVVEVTRVVEATHEAKVVKAVDEPTEVLDSDNKDETEDWIARVAIVAMSSVIYGFINGILAAIVFWRIPASLYKALIIILYILFVRIIAGAFGGQHPDEVLFRTAVALVPGFAGWMFVGFFKWLWTY